MYDNEYLFDDGEFICNNPEQELKIEEWEARRADKHQPVYNELKSNTYYIIHLFKQKRNTTNSSLPNWIWEECAASRNIESIEDVIEFFQREHGWYENIDVTFKGLVLEDEKDNDRYKIIASFRDDDLRCKNRSQYVYVAKNNNNLLESIIKETNSTMCYGEVMKVIVDKIG